MTSHELRQRYLDFFKSKNHAIIPSASLIPENDPSVLFTTAGMHPLVPFLLGEQHPAGTRLADAQKCIRTGDIDDVGDNRHLTFFEMLGNWSLGDYFKKEAIEWSFEFLTDKEKGLGLDPRRLYVTVFKGEDGPTLPDGSAGASIPRDEEAISIWKETFAKAGMDVEVAGDDEMVQENVRIIPLGTDDNFWIAGATGPCGGDTEMFYDTQPEEGMPQGKFSELVDSFRFIEIWNDVFMEFNKTADGRYEKLARQNVDTGMGLERTVAVITGKRDVFETDLFAPLFEKLQELSGKAYGEYTKEFRVICDHIKAATMILGDDRGVGPSNTGQGYILRRLIRRAVRYGRQLGLSGNFTAQLADVVIGMYRDAYPEVERNATFIREQLTQEEEKFRKTLEQGMAIFNRLSEDRQISGNDAFTLFTTYGFPFELTQELAKEQGYSVNTQEFEAEMKKHAELSKTAAAGMFKGGLADASEETVRLHTAAHLMLEALRRTLGTHIEQKGSNITAERLRFDISHPDKITPEQIKQIEDIVNEQIQKDLPVHFREMPIEEARQINATGVFGHKYGEQVKVYFVGGEETPYSKEICGGPHVTHTGELGRFKIAKEESSGAGVRRIKAVLE